MATENILHREVLDFKKYKFHSLAFKFSEIVNRHPPAPSASFALTYYSIEDFPYIYISLF